MLRKLRICLAAIFLVGITLLFLGVGHDWWGWMTKLQLLPSLLRLIGGATLFNVLIVFALILLTFLLGRIYCSVICPLGVFQDLVIWLRRKWGEWRNKYNARLLRKGKGRKGVNFKKRFAFVRERKVLRYGILIALIVSWFVWGQVLISLLAPYSAYGRIVRGIVGIGKGAPLALIAVGAASLLVIVTSALLWGREWCNSICPVGSLLSLISRHSLWQVNIDSTLCNNCGRCYRECKARCIDGEHHSIDHSRCIDCFDCIGHCSGKAISFSPIWKRKGEGASKDGKGMDRRAFLASGAAIGVAALANASEALAKTDKSGALAKLIDKQEPERKGTLLPPGAAKDFRERCTSCQLCVSACPNGVLKPGTSLEHLLQPQMSYLDGHCRPECNMCSRVCPNGAIQAYDIDAKSLQVIGIAKVKVELCLAANKEAGCGNCARHCPMGAISMITDEQGRRRPVVMEERCIGCGACEHLCPARPLSAIYVESRNQQ